MAVAAAAADAPRPVPFGTVCEPADRPGHESRGVNYAAAAAVVAEVFRCCSR